MDQDFRAEEGSRSPTIKITKETEWEILDQDFITGRVDEVKLIPSIKNVTNDQEFIAKVEEGKISPNIYTRRLHTSFQVPFRQAMMFKVTGLLIICMLSYIVLLVAFIQFNLTFNSNDTNVVVVGDEREPSKVVSCYYTFPNSNSSSSQLLPDGIHPFLCTHINIGFAQVVDKEIQLEDQQFNVLFQVVKLKHVNPGLKILLSVGGANGNGTDGFPEMIIDHASRKIFIKSIKKILKTYNLDGIDLDWEFPALEGVESEVHSRQRQHFSQLLREIRMEYLREKKDYILTIAAAAPQPIVDVSYDIDQLNLYVDYVNIMTYDYHFYDKVTPFTGLNSPLYVRSTEDFYMATLNINSTVHMYLNKGLYPSKLVVGIPTYGHTFRLVNSNNHGINSPALGVGLVGNFGYADYPTLCTYLSQYKTNITVVQDDDAKVPYLYMDKEWISYETPQSVMEKAKFIKDNNLRGAMIYSLNADDYEGVCGNKVGGSTKFPLAMSVRNSVLFSNCCKYL